LKVLGAIPVQEVTEEYPDHSDLKEVVQNFKDQYPDADISSIDGKIVEGLCEACSIPIFEGDDSVGYNPEDRVYTCKDCLNKE
jgi:hypothetical protein